MAIERFGFVFEAKTLHVACGEILQIPGLAKHGVRAFKRVERNAFVNSRRILRGGTLLRSVERVTGSGIEGARLVAPGLFAVEHCVPTPGPRDVANWATMFDGEQCPAI